MQRLIAAIQLGTDPVAPLPPAGFHRTLEDMLYCPKCDVAYSLVVDYDWAIDRFFAEESRRHLALLRKTIARGHGVDHRMTHLETNGVTVTLHGPPEPRVLPPVPKHIM